MKSALIIQPEMKLLAILKKIINNPWIGIAFSLAIIIPSLYKILDNMSILRIEYLLLAVAFPIYIKSLKKIFDQILDGTDDFYEQ